MSPRSLAGLGPAAVLVLALALPAQADFVYERRIPAPDVASVPDCVAGLDHADSSLVVVTTYDAGTEGGSFVFKINPMDGAVRRQEAFPGVPGICSANFWQLSAGAFTPSSGGTYWAADECGEICEFAWEDSVDLHYSVTMPGAPQPVSLAARAETLYVLDDEYDWILARYDRGETVHTDTIPLGDMSEPPLAVTTWRGHLLVSSAPSMELDGTVEEGRFLLWEYTTNGVLLGTHTAESPAPCVPRNIAFVGDWLYVTGACPESILVFGPRVYEQEVPAGDSVVVGAIPSIVQVVFDSVSTGGIFIGEVVDQDPCPPLDGVAFFSQFYHLTTNARFDYAAEVTVSTPEGLPPGVDPRRVRVLARPSGGCQAYLDITTAPTELPTTLMSITRTKSEDDEFSVFALGEDWRPPRAAVEFKFDKLGSDIETGQDSIPPGPLMRMRNLLGTARSEYYRGRSYAAADRADSIALTAREVPLIPHTYDPGIPGRNLAGQLVSDAHTLAFSLRYSAGSAIATGGFFDPDHIDASPDGFIRAYIDAPPGFEIIEVDNQHIYVEHEARAIPESTSVGPYVAEGKMDTRRVRTVFHADEVAAVLPPVGETTVMLTCFINGHEVFSEPTIFGPGAAAPSAAGDVATALTVKSNPSASWVDLELTSRAGGPLEIRIYSVEGQLVRVLLVDGSPGGKVAVTWRGDNQEGRRVSAGTYFVVARLDGKVFTRKTVLQR